MFRKIVKDWFARIKFFSLFLIKRLKSLVVPKPSSLYFLLLLNLFVLLVILARHPVFFFTNLVFRINLVFVLAFHVYLGLNSILKDYIDSPGLRRFFCFSVVSFLTYGLLML